MVEWSNQKFVGPGLQVCNLFLILFITRFYFIWTEISNPARNCCANVLPRSLTEFLFFDASEEGCMSCSPNNGPSDFKFCMEFFLELYTSLSVAAWLVPIPVCWQARIKRLWSRAGTQAFLFSDFVRSQPTGEIRTSKSNVIETDGKKIFSSTNFCNFQPRRRCHKLAFW